MQTILNVGLITPHGAGLVASDVVHDARWLGITVHRCDVFQSDSEPTAVLIVDAPHAALVNALALATNQDCIAVYDAATGGRLIGPRAAAWGAFRADAFILPDGSRLGATLAADAADDNMCTYFVRAVRFSADGVYAESFETMERAAEAAHMSGGTVGWGVYTSDARGCLEWAADVASQELGQRIAAALNAEGK